MDAVLETYDATDSALWPIADPPAHYFLALSGELSARELGTAMAVLTSYNKTDHERRTLEPEDSAEQVSHLVRTDCAIAPGGLRIRDTVTAVTALPGCCFGLENWRDWLDLMNGEEPWLGHDPTPRSALARLERTPTGIPPSKHRTTWPSPGPRTLVRDGAHVRLPSWELAAGFGFTAA
ncbi:hypothetical protein ACIHCV_40110 [Streptomyces sp. NPDC051956]|uniref:hypothetical protein n=1 Tax=Streptomyces sp. NPDC051956 TaxID=3365677 RepID=UPI0037D3669B